MSFTLQFENQILFASFLNSKGGQSFGPDEAQELWRGLSSALKDRQPKGFVLESAHPRLFCSGGNLKYYAGLKSKLQGVQANRKIAQVLQRISDLPIPTVVLVNGDCFGGGVEILSAFDFVLAAPDVLLGLWQRRVGLSFGWGGGSRLLRRLSKGRLLREAMWAHEMSAYEAARIGLVDEVCPRWALRSRAETLVSKSEVAWTRKWNEKNESQIFEKLWWGPAHRDALRKFSGR